MLPAAAGYDRAITVFSPDGRLYQVEYAIETVRRGTLAVGIKSKDGVVLAVEEKARKLQVSDITQKIFQIDDHIGVAAAGYIPDARTQVDHGKIIMSKIADDNFNSVILRPYITEKTFNLIEKENKLTFIVSDKAFKKDVKDAIKRMYEGNVKEVNIFRTVQGKKAIVKFTKDDEARQLATKLGLV